MSDFTYLPTDWQDEVIPKPRAVLEDFLQPTDDMSIFRLVPPEDKESEFYAEKILRVGDVVHFDRRENFGSFTALWTGAEWQTDRPYPSRANCFYQPDVEEIYDSFDELVSGADWNAPLDPSCNYDVSIYLWEDHGLFELTLHDGKPKFVQRVPS